VRRTSRNVVLVVLAALLLVGSLALALWPTAKRGVFSEVLSTFRADSLGGKALFATLERAGFAPRRHTEDLTALPAAGVVFVLNPEAPRPALEGLPRGPTFSRAERDAVRAFVEGGGRVVVVANRTTALHRDFEVQVVDPPPDAAARARSKKGGHAASARGEKPRTGTHGAATLDATTGHAGAAKRLAARRVHHLDVKASDTRARFVHDGSAVVASIARGRGEAVFVSAPSLAGNALLGSEDNLVFWAELATPRADARGAELRFDEYHHGHKTPRGLVALAAATELHFVLWQLALAGVVLLWAGMRRLPPRATSDGALRDDAGRGGAEESLAAMASLYERGRLGRHAAQRISAWLEQELAERFHLRAARGRELAAALARRGRPELAAQLELLLAQRDALRERPRPRELLAFARAASALRRALQEASKTTRRTETPARPLPQSPHPAEETGAPR